MKMTGFAWLIASLFAGISSAHAETAFTTRPTDLQAQALSDALIIATLPADSKVDVSERRGAWSEVKTSSGQSGWVRMTSLRIESGAASAPNSSNALKDLFAAGRTSNSGTATTGVKGFDEEDLQNAQPNFDALKKMDQFEASKEVGQVFANKANLEAISVKYLPDPRPSRRNDSAEGGN